MQGTLYTLTRTVQNMLRNSAGTGTQAVFQGTDPPDYQCQATEYVQPSASSSTARSAFDRPTSGSQSNYYSATDRGQTNRNRSAHRFRRGPSDPDSSSSDTDDRGNGRDRRPVRRRQDGGSNPPDPPESDAADRGHSQCMPPAPRQRDDGLPPAPSDSGEDDSRHGDRRPKRNRAGGGQPPDPGDDGTPSSKCKPPGYAGKFIKPHKFDGTGCFESFIMNFLNAAKYNGWSEIDKDAWLCSSVQPPASQLLWHCENLTFKEKVERLRKRYSAQGLEGRYQTELSCRRRHKGETLRELCQDVSRLMALAFPGETSHLADHIAKNAFLNALDPELAHKVRSEAPKNLDDALRRAQQIEVSYHVMESTPCLLYTSPSPRDRQKSRMPSSA